MDLRFTIDPDLCLQCGDCADDCPYHIIDMASGMPALKPSRVHHCIACQHCLAVCPTGALSIFGIDPRDSMPLPESLPTRQQTAALLRGRRSVRRFGTEPLPREEIDFLLQTVANAPTGKNRRQLMVTLVDDPAVMRELRQRAMTALRRVVAERRLPREFCYFRHVIKAWDQGRDIIFRNAPHLLTISSPAAEESAQADIHIAMTCFELLASAAGVGVLWNAMIPQIFSLIPEENMDGLLGIPADHVRGPFLLFGHPAVRYYRTVQRDQIEVNRVRLG